MTPRVTFIQHSRAYYGAVDIGDFDQIAIMLENHPDAGEVIIRWECFTQRSIVRPDYDEEISHRYAMQLIAHNNMWRTLKHFPELFAFMRDEAHTCDVQKSCMMPNDFAEVLRQRFGYVDVTPVEAPHE